ncbi:MAG: cob(I)yrinic acid a,c-diamide adenosyltransferase [Ardenticatenales bacterium]|nr:cob(I)yrinic acid a,c-diamide adenosyltransferase [Ardenticatenales bacterium]
MKIYTRTGDEGKTGLFGGQRVSKDSPRVEAYGAVDETNATLAIVRTLLEPGDPLHERLVAIQNDLFVLGGDLATPASEGASQRVPRMTEADGARLEQWIDEADAELEPMRSFILPGGTPAAAHLHLARTICRRAERRVVTLAHSETISPHTRVYLNRLSDLLFTWARLVNARSGIEETPWVPRKSEEPPATNG